MTKNLGKPPTKLTRVIKNIGLYTSPGSTKITPENLGETIEQMDHELPIICS